jgi:transposase
MHNLLMKHIDSKKLSETQFKRYTGISWSTFYVMVEQLQKQVPAKGRPSKLSLEDQVLLCLSYWRSIELYFTLQQAMVFQSQQLRELYVMWKTA